MAATIEASLFGAFALRREGVDVRPRGRKTCGLIAYVIGSERGRASRTRLTELLWGDRGETQARNSLRQALRELRAGPVAGVLDVSRSDVAMVPGGVADDVARIGALAARADHDGLAAALAGIEGQYLDDLYGLSPAFDEWLLVERVRRQEWLFSTVSTCLPRIEEEPTAGGRMLLGELERLDPLNETVVRARLWLDHAMGDVPAVHRRYRRLTNDLLRELSVPPSRETRELFNALVAKTRADVDPEPETAVSPAEPPAAETSLPPLVLLRRFEAEGDAETGRIAATLTDGICAALSQSSEFRTVQAEAIGGDQLHLLSKRAVVALDLHGSVRRIRSTITVSARLCSAGTGFVVWAEQFVFTLDDRADMGAPVGRIVGAVNAGIEHDLAGAPALARADDVATLYSRGKRQARDGRTLDMVREGMASLERVLELDPRHVGARLRLAQLYNTDFHYLIAGHDVGAARARAMELAVEAAEIEPSSLRVRLRLAWCRLRQSDWAGAAEIFHAARAVTAHDADSINECGFGLAQLGELETARELIDLAFRLNPFAPAEYHADLAVLLTLAGDHARAEAHFEVCGEQRLFWQVLRLSNLHRLDPSAARLRALQDRFVKRFQEIWIRAEPAGLDDVLAWARTTFCFRRREDRRLVDEALSVAWLTIAPAGADSSG
jgi:DNA-binding SARP family transcriptional activator